MARSSIAFACSTVPSCWPLTGATLRINAIIPNPNKFLLMVIPMGRYLSDPEDLARSASRAGNSHYDFWHRAGARKNGRYRRCAPFLIVSLSLRINPPDKSFDVCLDKWCHSLENEKKRHQFDGPCQYAVVDPPQYLSSIDVAPLGPKC